MSVERGAKTDGTAAIRDPSAPTMDPLADDKFRFVRFVSARTGVPDFPLHHIGSGFTFLAADTVCLVTARHVIDNNQADPLGVVLPPLDGSTKWWASNACVHLESGDDYKDDNAYADLALYSMHTPPSLRRHLNEHDFLTIPKGLRLAENTPLLAFGYKAELDLEGQRLIGDRFDIEGTYAGATGFRGLHTFHSQHLQSIDPNGLSGGPVTVQMSDGSYVLVGIIVQGSSASGKLHFVTAEWVIGALEFALPGLFEKRSEVLGDKADTELW